MYVLSHHGFTVFLKTCSLCLLHQRVITTLSGVSMLSDCVKLESRRLVCEISCRWVNRKHKQLPADLFWLSVVSLLSENTHRDTHAHTSTHIGPLSIAVSIATTIAIESGLVSVGGLQGGWASERQCEIKAVHEVKVEVCVWGYIRVEKEIKQGEFLYFSLVHTFIHSCSSPTPRFPGGRTMTPAAWLSSLIIIPLPLPPSPTTAG